MNVLNERLKASSLHVGSWRSADSEFQVGPATAKDRRQYAITFCYIIADELKATSTVNYVHV